MTDTYPAEAVPLLDASGIAKRFGAVVALRARTQEEFSDTTWGDVLAGTRFASADADA